MTARSLPAALGAAAVLALVPTAPALAADQKPNLDAAASAILIDARDGSVLLSKRPTGERSMASTTKLMTALLTLERTKPDQVFTAAKYRAAPIESKISLRPGERMRVSDLFEGLMLESANDAAVTLAEGISGSRPAFVRDMNERAAELGLRHTRYSNPIGLDEGDNHSSAGDLAALARRLMADRRFASVVGRPTAVLESGARRRVVNNRNDLIGRYPYVKGVKTGRTREAGYVLVGAASNAAGARVISVVMGTPSESARDATSLALLQYGLKQFQRRKVLDADDAGGFGRRSLPRRAHPAGAAQRPAGPGPPRPEGRHARGRPEGAGRDARGPAGGHDRGAARRQGDRPRGAGHPSRRAWRGAAAQARTRARWCVHGDSHPAVGFVRHSGSGAPTVAPQGTRASGAQEGTKPGQGPCGGTDRMIITVTLNAAIDKTLAVPNFRLGRRHRAVEQTSMSGGKGVNVARALKSLGRPVIATGFAGGPTGTRIIEQLTDEHILNDFVRIGEESRMSTAVVDPTSGEQTEINERGPTVTEAELELFVDKLLYLAQGAAICVFSGSLPGGVDPGLYARLVGELRKMGVFTVIDAEGDPMRLATRAGPDVVSPNELEAEELVGHEFADAQDRATAVAEIVDMGAHEALMTMPDGALALLGTDTDATRPRELCRATLDPLESVSSVGSGDAFLAGWVAAHYEDRPAHECLRFGVACGAESTQHFGAGVLDPREVGRLLNEVALEVLDHQPLSLGR